MTISQDNEKVSNNSQPETVLPRMTEQSESTYLAWSKVPEAVKNNVLDVAKFLYQERKDRLIITGEHNTGKTFTIEQFAYHSNKILHDAKMVPDDQEVAVFWADARGYANGHENYFIQTLLDTVASFEGEVIIYTNNYYTGMVVEKTVPSVRLIMELAPERFSELQQAGMDSRSYQICTGFSVDFNKSQTTKCLTAYHKKAMEDHYSVVIPRNFIKTFVNYVYENSEITKDNDGFETETNKIPMGFWVDCLDEMLSEATFKPEKYQKDNGELITSKVIERTFNDNKDFFNPVNAGEDVVKAIMEALGGDVSDFGGDGKGMPMGMPPSFSGGTIVLSGGPMGLRGLSDADQVVPRPDDSTEGIQYQDISTLSDRIKKKVVGQDKVVEEVAESFWVPAAGLSEDDKPVRSMLFLGPTGVGKTKLAQTLAEELSEEPMHMIRLDMSEYSEKHDSHKLFGAPAGYVGFEEGGVLTTQIQDHPNSLILLDEVEKASPAIWDSFLQVLDAGRMTDSHGEVVDFSNTVIVMTSNLGANKKTHSTMGYTTMNSKPDQAKEQQLRRQNALKEMEQYFKPEFINRINSTFVFDRLPEEVLEDIAILEIKYLIDRVSLKSQSKALLNAPGNAVVKKIIENSDADKYGARDIKRNVEKSITKLVAQSIVKQRDQRNTLNLVLDENGNIIITSEKRKRESVVKEPRTKKRATSSSDSVEKESK